MVIPGIIEARTSCMMKNAQYLNEIKYKFYEYDFNDFNIRKLANAH